MAQNAELVIKSDSVIKTTEALDRLIDRFEKLEAASQSSETSSGNLAKGQTKIKNALDQSAIAQQKAIALLDLERQGLDKNSSQYAKLKAEILAREAALKKGIKTDSEEYRALLKNIKAKELATAKTRQYAKAQKDAQKNTDTSKKNINAFTNALDDAAKQASLIDGPLGGVASRITTLSGILKGAGGAIGLTLAAVGVSVALMTRELSKGLSVAADAEVQMRSFEAQIKATGGAAGFTATQLDEMARSFAMNTLDNRKGVSEVVGVMTSFKNVSGEAFKQAIGLSQDLGIVMKTSSVSAARTLGKALENPIENYTQLKRVGVEFDKEEKKRIALAQQAGEMWKAQSIIINKLGESVGGVAKAQADSLAGDLDTFGQKWEEVFERAGEAMLPLARSATQLGIDLLDAVQLLQETGVETTLRIWKDNTDLTSKSTEELTKLLERHKAEQKKYSEEAEKDLGSQLTLWGEIKTSIAGVVSDELADYVRANTDNQKVAKQIAELERQKVKEIENTINARERQSKGVAKLTDKQSEYLEQTERDLQNQTRLTQAFLETGDTRSAVYRETKAAIDAETQATKLGLEYDEKRKEQIKSLLLVISDLTEARVRHNTVIQKTKALETKNRAVEREIELYELTRNGLSKNSDEYLKATAIIDARNSAIQGSIELGSKEHKIIEASTIALYKQQQQLKSISALRATDDESATFKTLERQIEIQNLVNKGIQKNTEDYYLAVAAIDTRNTAARTGIEIGSKEYETLLKQNEALAQMRNELQQVNNLKELGFTQNSFGKVIVDDTRQSILAEGDRLRNVLGELLSSGTIDKEQYADKIDELKTFFNDSLRELTIPLGITIDEEGNEHLLSSVESVYIERDEKLRELEFARKAGLLEDEETFNQRRNEIMQEYDQKAVEKRQEIFEKSAEHLARLRQMEVAGNIQAGLENLAAAKKTSSGLAKAAKAMSMFKASTALVDAIANAMAIPWPANIPAISQAFVQGTQLISMASNLNEPSFAFGGVDIQGAGTARSDSIKANIANGESVITAPATARHKETLKRMNAGLPIGNGGGGRQIVAAPQINIQGDASEKTVALIENSLRDFEDKVQQIAQGVSYQTIQEENEVGGLLNEI